MSDFTVWMIWKRYFKKGHMSTRSSVRRYPVWIPNLLLRDPLSRSKDGTNIEFTYCIITSYDTISCMNDLLLTH